MQATQVPERGHQRDQSDIHVWSVKKQDASGRALGELRVDLQSGDILRLETDSVWSPKCALSDHVNRIAGSNQSGVVIDVTGPRGYTIQTSSDSSVTFGVSNKVDTRQASSGASGPGDSPLG
jgi:hypothetical protein